MSSTHTSLAAQANERTARLAALKNLKRKQAPTTDASRSDEAGSPNSSAGPAGNADQKEGTPEAPDVTRLHLSGRNYDAAARGPRLGFDAAPTAGASTVEVRAAALDEETVALRARQEAEQDRPLDLWRLRPKKPDWDLKRDLEAKLARVNVRTDNAVARLVRRRVLEQQDRAKKAHGQDAGAGEAGAGGAGADGDGAGMDGAALVEGVHLREREGDNGDEAVDDEMG